MKHPSAHKTSERYDDFYKIAVDEESKWKNVYKKKGRGVYLPTDRPFYTDMYRYASLHFENRKRNEVPSSNKAAKSP